MSKFWKGDKSFGVSCSRGEELGRSLIRRPMPAPLYRHSGLNEMKSPALSEFIVKK